MILGDHPFPVGGEFDAADPLLLTFEHRRPIGIERNPQPAVIVSVAVKRFSIGVKFEFGVEGNGRCEDGRRAGFRLDQSQRPVELQRQCFAIGGDLAGV